MVVKIIFESFVTMFVIAITKSEWGEKIQFPLNVTFSMHTLSSIYNSIFLPFLIPFFSLSFSVFFRCCLTTFGGTQKKHTIHYM